jgi:hypothetical protein
MPDQDKQNPTTGSETDISKAQSQQQPPNQASQGREPGAQSGQFETGSQSGAERTGDQAQTGQAQTGAGPDEGLQGDLATQQRTDIEGGSLASEASGEAGAGFVGAKGQQDSSSQLIDEEDEDFAPDGQGAPEGK